MSLSLPRPPRQKMINLMYIVLTALLALNVSAEILNAFKTVNQSIDNSNTAIGEKNAMIYQQFAKQMQQDPQKVGPLKASAEKVKVQCETMYTYIDSLKEQIVNESGGRDETGQIKKLDNLDAVTRVMVNFKKGPELKGNLEKLRASLLTFLDPAKKAAADKTFPLRIEMPKNSKKKTWTEANFDMVPTIAAVTILSKFQNDIRNAEAEIIDDLYARINAQQFTFDTYTPLVALNSGYVMNGQKVEAKIMLGAYSSTVSPTISVNGSPVPVSAGVGTFSTVASGVGEHSYNVNVSLKDKDGTLKTYTAPLSYMVGASSLSVSADKMNVLFIGLNNPVSVAAAGVPAESVSASISQGSLQKTGTGQYIAKVTSVGTANINVSATIGGQAKNLGTMKFRVMRVPDPVAEVGGSKGGSMSAAVFRAQMGVQAVLENFYFDTKFEITHFTAGFDGTGFPDYLESEAGSAYFSAPMKQYLARCRPGTRVYIDDIRAKGPDGTTRTLPAIAFKLR